MTIDLLLFTIESHSDQTGEIKQDMISPCREVECGDTRRSRYQGRGGARDLDSWGWIRRETVGQYQSLPAAANQSDEEGACGDDHYGLDSRAWFILSDRRGVAKCVWR